MIAAILLIGVLVMLTFAVAFLGVALMRRLPVRRLPQHSPIDEPVPSSSRMITPSELEAQLFAVTETIKQKRGEMQQELELLRQGGHAHEPT